MGLPSSPWCLWRAWRRRGCPAFLAHSWPVRIPDCALALQRLKPPTHSLYVRVFPGTGATLAVDDAPRVRLAPSTGTLYRGQPAWETAPGDACPYRQQLALTGNSEEVCARKHPWRTRPTTALPSSTCTPCHGHCMTRDGNAKHATARGALSSAVAQRRTCASLSAHPPPHPPSPPLMQPCASLVP